MGAVEPAEVVAEAAGAEAGPLPRIRARPAGEATAFAPPGVLSSFEAQPANRGAPRLCEGRLCALVDCVENGQRALKRCGRHTNLSPKRMVKPKDDEQQQAEQDGDRARQHHVTDFALAVLTVACRLRWQPVARWMTETSALTRPLVSPNRPSVLLLHLLLSGENLSSVVCQAWLTGGVIAACAEGRLCTSRIKAGQLLP